MTYQLSLKLLAAEFGIVDESESTILGLTMDSRKVEKNHAFFACAGSQMDGRDFIEQAIEKGASAVFYECKDGFESEKLSVPSFGVSDLASKVGFAAAAFYQNPSEDLQVFGVTGTNGKTTCCYLLVQALTELGLNAAMIGTIGVGQLDALDQSGLTTPDAIFVQESLANFRDLGITQVCMEVSSHALDQGRVNGVHFFAVMFTNLSRDHLDYHGDMKSYGEAKQRLFTEFASQLAIVNADDDLGRTLVDVSCSEFIVQYGKSGDVSLVDCQFDDSGILGVVEGNGVEFEIQTPLIGKVNLPNIELLIATLLALSTDVETIQGVLSCLKPAPGRMERFEPKPSVAVVVDYAHTPDALRKALESVRSHVSNRLWCVFGCGGDRDVGKRPMMGVIANELADVVIITNDNPRSESPQKIADDILGPIKGGNEVRVVLDRAEAISQAINDAQAGDVILLAGKGHEATQTIGKEVLSFSDRDYVERGVFLGGSE